MDNPSFQDDTAAARTSKLSTTERPPPPPIPTVKKLEAADRPLQRKASQGYLPRSRSNSLYPSEDEDESGIAQTKNRESSSRRNSRRPSYDPNARRMSLWSNLAVAVVVPEDRSRTPSPSPPPTPPPEELSPEELKKIPSYKRPYVQLKKRLQSHPVARQFFPPKGNTAVALTLIVAAVAVFVVARSVLGPIAGPGGPIFSLMILILLCLIAGQIIKIMVFIIFRYTGFQVRCPPFLGMLVIGIILKNVPYNFGQFGRADCYITINNTETHVFVDSINQLEESRVNSLPLRRKRSDDNDEVIHMDVSWEHNVDAISRKIRSSDHGGDDHGAAAKKEPEDPCRARYIGHDLDPSITVLLRSVCLTVILLMAGLELDPVALQKLAGMVVSATVIPCLVEACTAAILAHFILGFDWMVGFILGFLLTGVSPAVIIPSILSLSSGGFGLAKGIPTLTIAVCSADDVFAIAGFGIVTGLYFNPDASVASLALQGPIEIIIGVVFGFFWGTIAQWLPNKDHHNVVFFRWVVLFSGGLISIFGAHIINYEGAGGIACIIGSFLAGRQWRKEGWGDHNPITKALQKMWIILGPVIFGLIGTEIQINKLDGSTVGYGIVVLCVSLLVRMAITYFSVHCGNLNLKERIFMACAWVPKATVQAALGPVFLARARKAGLDPQVLAWGEQILTMAVLSIILFAPLGAILIQSLGPVLLSTGDDEEDGDSHHKGDAEGGAAATTKDDDKDHEELL